LALCGSASAKLTLEPAFTGGTVNLPMYVTSPPGDSHRLFIVERTGVIRVAVDGVLQPTPFLDISDRVATTDGEEAMGSMAFDPGYEDPASPGYGLFYVYFAATAGAGDSYPPIHLEEFRADPAQSPNVADPNSARVVLTIPHNASPYHYGGTIHFGPDNLLYIGTGDGDDAVIDGNARNTKSLLGKILRIDPHQSGSDPYSIPAGNPFAGQPLCSSGSSATTDCPEVLAWGLRNPFRWSFDRQTGDIAIADVGQDQWEEVDYVPASGTLAGDDFGWPCYEGPQQAFYFPPFCTIPDDQRVDPVAYYEHPDPGVGPPMAITGGVVVRDPELPSLVGRYLYADFFAGVIHSLHLDLPSATDDRIETDLSPVKQLVAFNEDAAGHVYVVQLQKSFTTTEGSVQRLVCSDCQQVRVVNKLDPSSDPGKFDLSIAGTTYDNGGAGFGDGGDTGFQPVVPGSVTVSAAAHPGTKLSDYNSDVSCDSGKGSSNSNSKTFTLAYGDQVTCTITEHRKQLQVAIAINPTALPAAPINTKSQGVTPVAILSSSTFDATTVDPATVRFGATGTEASSAQAAVEDVNRDGRPDLVLRFDTQRCGFTPATTTATLTGTTRGGQAIQGAGAIRIVP
jgi:glucose/arabinose dehydrogenase